MVFTKLNLKTKLVKQISSLFTAVEIAEICEENKTLVSTLRRNEK